MAEKTAKDFNEYSKEELDAELLKCQEKLFKLRFQHKTAPLKNPLEIRNVRRMIARFKTRLKGA